MRGSCWRSRSHTGGTRRCWPEACRQLIWDYACMASRRYNFFYQFVVQSFFLGRMSFARIGEWIQPVVVSSKKELLLQPAFFLIFFKHSMEALWAFLDRLEYWQNLEIHENTMDVSLLLVTSLTTNQNKNTVNFYKKSWKMELVNSNTTQT